MALKDNIKWKPCPFCGGTDFDIKGREDFMASPETMHMTCNECEADVWLFTRNHNMSYPEALLHLADKWNRRAGQ